MFNKNLLLALRTLNKHLGYTLLNLTGLSIGMAACLLIVLYISHERSFDQFHRYKDRLYRVNYDVLMGDEQVISPSVPVFVGPELKRRFPEVVDATRFSTEWRSRTIRYKDRLFDESGFAYADPNFFDLFDFKALKGDLKSALARPNTLILTKSMAHKYFGTENPIGKILNFNNNKDYEVAAVMEDVPANSHFSFNFLTSHYSFEGYAQSEKNIEWNNPNYTTWVLLQPGARLNTLAKKIENWVYPPEEKITQRSLHLPLEPLSAVHFNTTVFNYTDALAITDSRYLDLLGAIALLILCIACINYINLATAKASVRAKETGVRKALGAKKGQLVTQFLGESFILVLPAIVLSVALTALTLPMLNELLGKEIGIRKVLGAKVAGITLLLTKDFLKLVFIAIIIAMPIAYYFTKRWLADFAYRIELQWWMFALAGLLAVGIAFLTVGFQSVKAALMNPVKSLRSE